MKLLLDEMYPSSLADALRDAGLEVSTAAEAGAAGRSDADVLDIATSLGAAVLTENVSDFARIASERTAAGKRHAGVLIALSSRFTRRASGRRTLVAAILAVAGEPIADRVLYLQGARA